MSRTKKDATEALGNLAHYLRNDRGGVKMVESVSRYIGELRQDKTALKSEVEQLKNTLVSIAPRLDAAHAEIASLRNDLSAADSRRRQAESQAALDRQALDELVQLNAPPVSADLDMNGRKWWHVFKKLKARMPVPPSPCGVAWTTRTPTSENDKLRIFEIGDFIHKHTDDEFIKLGQFIVVSVFGLFGGVGFVAKTREGFRIGAEVSDSRMRHWVQWMHEQWLSKTNSKLADELYSPTEQEVSCSKHFRITPYGQ